MKQRFPLSGSFAFDSEAALDVLGIAGSLAAGSMSAMNLARTGSGLGALSRAGSQSSVLKNLLNTQNMLLFTRGIDQGSDMLNGLIVTSVGFKNIMRIKREVQDPELRRRLIAYELMAMIAAGTMTAINIKGMRGNKTRGYVYTGPQYNYVSPFKTGFPRPLQRSVCKSLGDGEFVGLRTMPLGATVSGKVLPYKPSSVKDNIKMGAGIRIDVKTKKVYASDLDLALYAKGGKAYSNDAAIELGNEISNKYGKKIVLHGDNYNGVLIDDEGAKRVAKKNEIIYIFDKKGFVEAGNYKDMVKKYIQTTTGGVKYNDNFTTVVTKQRTQHILYGDATGGGHLWPGLTGKTPFPESWTPEKIMHEISDIATDPNLIWKRSDGKTEFFYKNGKPARFTTIGERSGVKIKVVIEPAGEGIITAHPIN